MLERSTAEKGLVQ
jgi:hypothetical protein